MKKVIVDIVPFGMCNQLFMYAYGKYVQSQNNGELYLNYKNCKNVDHGATWDACLSHFNLNIDGTLFNNREIIRICGVKSFIFFIINRIKIKTNSCLEYGMLGRILKYAGIIISSNGDIHAADHYYETVPKCNIIWCSGLFQNPLIIKKIKRQLQKEIV